MLLIGLYLKNKTKQNRKQGEKKKPQKTDFTQWARLRIQLCLYSSLFFSNWKCRPKWLKLWTHPLAAVLVAHVGSLFWFITKLCDFPGMWILARAIAEKKNKNKNKNKNKQTNKKKTTCFSFFFFCFSPLFFPLKYHLKKKYLGVYACKHHEHPTPMEEKRQEWFQSKKTLNPLHFREVKSNPHRLNLPLHPFTPPPPPPHTHSAEQNCQGGQTSGVGMWSKVCIIVINKNKQHENNLWIFEKCHGKDLIQNVVYALKTK